MTKNDWYPICFHSKSDYKKWQYYRKGSGERVTVCDDCMGVAIEKYVSIHKVVEGIERGIYRKVDITPTYEDTDLEPTQEVSQYQDEKVLLLTYYGLVPREYLNNLEENKDIVELFPDNSYAEDYTDMVEAIVVIANDGLLLKAEENPYMMKDRPVLSYQDDTVPNRLLGRGTVEKAFNMQKAIDAQTRSHLDSLALTTSPMIAMDATRLPRGMKFEIKPGKAILTNGAPSEILYPFKFGQSDPNNLATAKEFDDYTNQTAQDMKKELNLDDDARFLDFDFIEGMAPFFHTSMIPILLDFWEYHKVYKSIYYRYCHYKPPAIPYDTPDFWAICKLSAINAANLPPVAAVSFAHLASHWSGFAALHT